MKILLSGLILTFFMKPIVTKMSLINAGIIVGSVHMLFYNKQGKCIRSTIAYVCICTIFEILKIYKKGECLNLIEKKLMLEIQHMLNIKDTDRDPYFSPTMNISNPDTIEKLRKLTADSNVLQHWIQILNDAKLLQMLDQNQLFWARRVCLLLIKAARSNKPISVKFYTEFRPQVILVFGLVRSEILGWLSGSAGYSPSICGPILFTIRDEETKSC